MCDRQARHDTWQAGYDAGRQQTLTAMCAAYQSRMLDDLIGVLAELLAEHDATRPAGQRDTAGRWARRAA